EIVSSGKEKASQIADAMTAIHLDARIVERRKSYVVYLKEGAQIVDMLNVMGARIALMDLENVRVLKEVRNSVNRQVNCETANLNKTIHAAVKQTEDICYIRDHMGLNSLPDGLCEISKIRLQYPDTPLKDLGTMLSVPLGKSGVNHRLRKISQIADSLREKNGMAPGGISNDNEKHEN
uniref:DNA-binding protein WhiA n=1 Tax=Eshraghiella crossota TaxID=45851 RepID=UPI004024E7D6